MQLLTQEPQPELAAQVMYLLELGKSLRIPFCADVVKRDLQAPAAAVAEAMERASLINSPRGLLLFVGVRLKAVHPLQVILSMLNACDLCSVLFPPQELMVLTVLPTDILPRAYYDWDLLTRKGRVCAACAISLCRTGARMSTTVYVGPQRMHMHDMKVAENFYHMERFLRKRLKFLIMKENEHCAVTFEKWATQARSAYRNTVEWGGLRLQCYPTPVEMMNHYEILRRRSREGQITMLEERNK